jgi:hypothetical protein
MLRRLCLLLPLLICGIAPLFAQDDALLASAHTRAQLRAGPGDTYLPQGVLQAGVEITIVGRNVLGNWLHITRTNGDGVVVIDGWMLAGYLNLDPTFRLGDLPISDLPDADLSTVDSQTMRQLYAVPVLPTIGDSVTTIYQYGQTLGNHPNVVTKIGDSVSHNPMYLQPLGRDDVELGAYQDLEDGLAFFAPSLAEPSIAAEIGMSTYVVFDPLWAASDSCQAGESPLICEYRRQMPAVAVIMFGANDVRSMDVDEYETQMRLILDQTLERGIIPILSTFSCHPDANLWFQCLDFNLRLSDLAAEYEIPLINLWSAARALPDYGLDVDHVHMTNSGFPNVRFSAGHDAWYGVALQNLLVLRVLDDLYHAVIIPQSDG